MSDPAELAKESLERAHEAHEHRQAHGQAEAEPAGVSIRGVAILISVLAAALALSEMGEKGAQNEYLTHHIAASDQWNFYQAKNIRSNLYAVEAQLLESLPTADTPEIRKKIEDARTESAHLDDDEKAGNGRKQLLAKAHDLENQRDRAFHTYHHFERVVGGLQIAIVLASVSIVTKLRVLFIAAFVLGGAAILYALGIALELV